MIFSEVAAGGRLRHGLGLLLAAVLIALLSNLLLWGLSRYLDAGRPLLNLDYTVAVVLIAFGWRRSGGLLLALFALVDLLSLLGQVFPFVRLGDVLYLARMLGQSTLDYQLLFAGGVLLLLLHWWLVSHSARRLRKDGQLLSLNVVVITYLVHYSFFGMGEQDRFWRVNDKLVESQSYFFLSSRLRPMLERYEGDAEFWPLQAAATASGQWPALQGAEQQARRLLLVVNESWGVPQDARIQQALLAPLRALPGVQLQRGELEFRGATVSGELRELCQLASSHLNLVDAGEALRDCLPHRLRRAGYRVQGMHAASSLMYDRIHWYPHAGFDQRVFFETHDWPQRCYSWPGACDLDMRQEVGRFFGESGAGFLYWLTLNTHHRYDLRDLRQDRFDCAAFAVDPAGESCRNLKLQAQFFAGLAELLQEPEMQGVEVLVVGDHEPRIMHKDQPVPVFADARVPWVSISSAVNHANGKPAP